MTKPHAPAPRAAAPDWDAIRAAFVAGGAPGALARQFRIHHFSILNRARREGWSRTSPMPADPAAEPASGSPEPAARRRVSRRRPPLEVRLARVLDAALDRIEGALAEAGPDALAEPRTLSRLDAILKLYPRLREAARRDPASPADQDRTAAHDFSPAEPAPGVDDLLGKFDRLRAAGELEIRARLAERERAAGA
ncbi:MAG: hypothetical protein LPL00_08585 [Alphaproteobacteria bacterium]|nr:hypothetical protein [Alphaproteobacteria bacterium]MDX5369668.1 hypothetical protein [Alphaproteobacteria bacterium]MDX5464303.1 hypothetical protein [Alphaproteobacteria bacterium]